MSMPSFSSMGQLSFALEGGGYFMSIPIFKYAIICMTCTSSCLIQPLWVRGDYCIGIIVFLRLNL
jgi:hypothetical protein